MGRRGAGNVLRSATNAILPDVWQPKAELPPKLLRSKLLRSGGYMLLNGLIDAQTTDALLAEAASVRKNSERGEVAESDGTEGRGGCPARAFRSSPGGPLHWGIYACAQMTDLLGQLCGLPMSPLGGGTYTYYESPGDFLALHRDVETCDLAVITCLSETGGVDAGGRLLVYPSWVHEPLSVVRAAGSSSATPVPLGPGDTVALLGGIVPHEVTPMSAEQERIIAVMCYRMAHS